MKDKSIKNYTPYVICGLASLFYVYDYFIQVSPAVMTNQLMRAYHIDAAGLGVLGSIFFYAYAGMQIPAGMLLDKYRIRPLLTLAIFISGAGALLLGLTHSFAFAGLSRFLVGFGSAFSFIGALYLATIWFEHRHFALIAGIIQFGGCLGSIFGEAPLAQAVNYFGWREVLITIGITTFFISLLFWLIIRDKRGGDSGKKSPKVSTSNSLREILRMPAIWWIAFIGFLLWIPSGSFGALWGVPYLMKTYHWSNTEAGAFCSIFWLSVGLASPFVGWFSDKIGSRRIPFYLCFSLGLIGSIILIFAHHLPISILVISLILLGLGPGIQSLTFGVAKDILPPQFFGTAAGFINMAVIAGGGIAQVTTGIILSRLWGNTMVNGLPVYTLDNYQWALLIIPISLLLGLILTYTRLPETHCKHLHPRSDA